MVTTVIMNYLYYCVLLCRINNLIIALQKENHEKNRMEELFQVSNINVYDLHENL